MKKIAVVLFNIGGPNDINSVRPYLFNFFSDKNIIALPFPLRKLVAFLISSLRYKQSSEKYMSIGGKSPLLDNTIAQQNLLQSSLNLNENTSYKCFTAMNYWHPFTKDVIKQVTAYNPDKIVLLPLYPHYSFATTRSSFEEWDKYFNDNKPEVKKINNYHDNEHFINSHCEVILNSAQDKIKNGATILFSAHGIPKQYVKKGDPYQSQIENSVNLIISALKLKTNLSTINYKLCYQSKVGPLEWLKPYFSDEIQNYKDKDIVIVPISFVSEHIETLEELDIEYKHLALKYGVKTYTRVPALGTNSIFIKCLESLVLN